MRLFSEFKLNCNLIKSVGLLGVSNVVGQGIAFTTSIILAIILTKNDYGYFRYVIRIGTFLVMFFAAGYSSALTRFIAADRERRDAYFSTVIVIVGIAFLAMLPFFLVLRIDILIYIVAIGYSIPLIYYGIIRGFVDYKKMAMLNMLRYGLILLLIFPIYIFAFLKTPIYVVGVYSFGGWIAILIIEFWKRTDIHLRMREVSKKIAMILTRFSIFSILSNVFYSSLITVGYILLEWNYGYRTVADYSMAVTLTVLYSFVPGAVNALLMPKVANTSMDRKIKFLKQAIMLNVSYILLVYVLVIFFGKWGLELLFGTKYLGAYPFLIIMSIGSVFGGIAHAFGAFWGGVNKPEYNTLATGVASGANILFVIFLFQVFDEYSVAIGYSLSLIFMTIAHIIILIKFKLKHS